MRALVTGGAGFIGSHIVERLVNGGAAVRVLDDLSTGTLAHLSTVADRVDFIKGDIRNKRDVARAVASVDVVFHEAAIASVPQSIADPESTFDVNVTGTLNLLMAARHAGVRRFVFASSAAVYGDAPVSPKHEDLLTDPLSPYGVSKVTCEQLCKVFNNLYGLETVSLRYFNVFGPRQDPASPYAAVIPLFVEAIQSGHRPVIYGDGEQSRGFIYVGDVVDANMLAAGKRAAPGRVVNVGSDVSISINSAFDILQRETGIRVEPDHRPARTGDVRDSLADMSRAFEVLGFRPRTSFTEGVRQMVGRVLAGTAMPLAG